jgi:hypothetical protein
MKNLDIKSLYCIKVIENLPSIPQRAILYEVWREIYFMTLLDQH